MDLGAVDCPGACLTNIPRLEGPTAPFLRQHKFNIAFENNSCAGSAGYVTEKLVHAMFAGCMPIYWGDHRVGEDFNTDSFISVHDYNDDFEEVVEVVRTLNDDDELFLEKIRQPWVAGNVLPEFMRAERLVRVFDALFEGKTT